MTLLRTLQEHTELDQPIFRSCQLMLIFGTVMWYFALVEKVNFCKIFLKIRLLFIRFIRLLYILGYYFHKTTYEVLPACLMKVGDRVNSVILKIKASNLGKLKFGFLEIESNSSISCVTIRTLLSWAVQFSPLVGGCSFSWNKFVLFSCGTDV